MNLTGSLTHFELLCTAVRIAMFGENLVRFLKHFTFRRAVQKESKSFNFFVRIFCFVFLSTL